LITDGPVLVTVEPANTPKVSAVPKNCALALVSKASNAKTPMAATVLCFIT
jgi:hypothetical protein